MSDQTVSKTQIMLVNCGTQPPSQVDILCRKFGELKSAVHFSKFGKYCCFVEYKSPEHALQAILAINANVGLGIKATFASIRDPSQNRNQQPSTSYGSNGQRHQARERSQGRKKNFNGPKQNARPPVANNNKNAQHTPVAMAKPQPVAAPVRATTANSSIIGPCIKCEAPAESQCEICFDAYCSVECQRLDWGRHKKECRPPPALIQPKKTGPVAQAAAPTAPANPPLAKASPARVQPPPPVSATTVPFLPLPTPIQPSMQVNLPESVKNFNKQNTAIPKPKHGPLPKRGDHVIITSVGPANLVYLQCIDKQTCGELNEVLGKVANYALRAPQVISYPTIGHFVLAEFGGCYRRALVLSLPPNKQLVKLAFIDSGHTVTIEWQKLKVLDDMELICAVRHNFRAALKGVTPKMRTKEVDLMLQDAIIKLDEFVVDFEGASLPTNRPPIVELVRFRDQKSLNAEIARLSGKPEVRKAVIESTPSTSVTAPAPVAVTVPKAKPVEPLNVPVQPLMTEEAPKNTSPYRYGTKDLIIKGVQNGKNLRILILDNDLIEFGKVAGIFYNDKAHLAENQMTVQKNCDKLTGPYTPRKFELCLVKFEGDWYRGMCIKDPNPDENFTIFFIDYGSFAEVEAEDIRRLHEELVKLPVYTKMCSIKGLPPDCSGILATLEEKFAVGNEIIAETVVNVTIVSEDINDSYAEITIKNLEGELKL